MALGPQCQLPSARSPEYALRQKMTRRRRALRSAWLGLGFGFGFGSGFGFGLGLGLALGLG